MVLLISTCPVGLMCHCLQAVLKPLCLLEIIHATIYAGSSLIHEVFSVLDAQPEPRAAGLDVSELSL